ncbi:hypothetical protein DFA_10902 [Cavenderia fasciculata]|uniref:Uncharacterized protein n=1 Tax=Cavenderia fasciculata TaxID=261658 RepID=F4QBQ6_CACFS|nr:uncharacterized protein DFA_10902 [Cavenderia fasciculata]EGG14644.1 hypothetical protein DFA_10902 [Cavenderia fasciculata]|eukprot:XP_004351152.1 hypothetical protein DFA_10902 [Cavenderia fasciculata]
MFTQSTTVWSVMSLLNLKNTFVLLLLLLASWSSKLLGIASSSICPALPLEYILEKKN